MVSTTRTPAGANLGRRGRVLWRRVTAEYELDPLERELLLEAARTCDALDDPAIRADHRESRMQRDLLGRLLSRLALPDEDEMANAAVRLGQRGGRAPRRKR